MIQNGHANLYQRETCSARKEPLNGSDYNMRHKRKHYDKKTIMVTNC